MTYQFEDFELDPERRELRHSTGLLSVQPQVFDVLQLLLEQPDRVVSKDELFERVWDGRIVSESTLSSRINAARRALGDDGDQQRLIRTVPRHGFRFIGDVTVVDPNAEVPPAKAVSGNSPASSNAQKIRFCKSKDGTQIAYATMGEGYPFVRAGHWLTHLEHDWHSPVWRPLLDELGRSFGVCRYDQRGNGLSDWSVDDLSLSAFVDDIEAVVDSAGLDKFALYGTSQGVPIAVAYAVRHPDRVSHLVLHGGFVQGRLVRDNQEDREQGQALLTLIRHGWGKPGSPFLKAFSSMFIPTGSSEQMESLVELQRRTTSPENAVRLRSAIDSFDISELIKEVTVPTLVLHARNDGIQPLDEGRKLAAGIPGAEFVLLESDNHVILPQEEAWQPIFDALRGFILKAE